MDSSVLILLIIICVGVLIYAIRGLMRVNSFQKGINEQSQEEIEAVKNTNNSELRSKEKMEDLQKKKRGKNYE